VFLTELCEDLRSALTEMRPVTLKAKIEQHFLPEERAVPVGLMLNELVTNALKYAFPGDRTGNVNVVFARDGETFHLTVSDDGIGIPPSDAPSTDQAGLGQRLVKSMVAQIEGSYHLEPASSGSGTVARISFPADP
jgi:two-component system, sensor histidine kinase PdtaS